MKKITLLILLTLILGNESFGQSPYSWSSLTRLTSGYIDTNPGFASLQSSFYGLLKWEFLVFQRKMDTTSQICVLKMNQFGLMDSVRYITHNNYINRNPSIAYMINNWIDSIKTSFAVWETNQNGKWDLYGSYFTTASGWSAPFPVDTTSFDKSSPKAIMINATDAAIIYSRSGKIIYRRFNAATGNQISETNLTPSLSQNCIKPQTGKRSNSWIVAFSAQKSDSTYALYKTSSSNDGVTWTIPDTVTTTGNNFATTIGHSFNLTPNIIYESKRNGRYGIFNSADQVTPTIFYSSNYDYYGLQYYLFPIITDQFSAQLSACVRKSADSTKIILDQHYNFIQTKDSVTIGDSSKKTSVAVNQGIHYGDAMVYVVFNKDTAGYTSLYYKRRLVSTGAINFTGNYAAADFRLHQNYPNPFNPTTKIKFDIPKASDVKLIIFDAAGRVIKNITQNNLTAGSYEYAFNGESLSSGIYYFRLETNDFAKTVKMVLVK